MIIISSSNCHRCLSRWAAKFPHHNSGLKLPQFCFEIAILPTLYYHYVLQVCHTMILLQNCCTSSLILPPYATRLLYHNFILKLLQFCFKMVILRSAATIFSQKGPFSFRDDQLVILLRFIKCKVGNRTVSSVPIKISLEENVSTNPAPMIILLTW